MENNKIKEIYKGHYFVLLDFPTTNDLFKILDSSYKYVWGIKHLELRTEWKDYDYYLFDKKNENIKVKARNLTMEFLIETNDFLRIIPDIRQTIQIIQTNHIPQYYLDLNKLEGKSKYDLLLQKVDYLFELELRGAIDYAPLVSPNIKFLEQVVAKLKLIKG
jgi:hypothetical protein